ncbi:hypothetical protein MNBD_DELTA01-618, partial [hydrothermal vent metagenome]
SESRRNYIIKLDTSLCRHCGFMYRTPILSHDEQRQYYESSYYETFKPQKPEDIDKTKNYLSENLEKKYGMYITFLKDRGVTFSDKRILDVGTGGGSFLFVCKKEGPAYILGIEPSKAATEMAQSFCVNEDVEVINGCLNDYPVEKIGKFDVVTMIGVIEHLSDPREILVSIRKYLTDDGVLYVHTHDESPGFFLDIKRQISLVHQLYFTRRTMSAFMEDAGFVVENMTTSPGMMNVIVKNNKAETALKQSADTSSTTFRISRFHYMALKYAYLFCGSLPHVFFVFNSSLRRLFILPVKFLRQPKRYIKRFKGIFANG